MKTSDWSVGSKFPNYDVGLVDPEKMKTMAILIQDPNPIHWDVDSVKRLGLGTKPINQGPNNMAYVVNALVSWVGGIEKFRNLKSLQNPKKMNLKKRKMTQRRKIKRSLSLTVQMKSLRI